MPSVWILVQAALAITVPLAGMASPGLAQDDRVTVGGTSGLNTDATLKFHGEEIILSSLEARRVFMFFFPDIENSQAWQNTAGKPLTPEQRGYAQTLLVEAIDASYAMGMVEAAWRAANDALTADPTRPAAALRGLVTAFVKNAAPWWFRHATKADLRDPRIYESVRTSIAAKHKSVVAIELGISFDP